LHRDERSLLWLEQLRQDIRYAFRQLGKSPGFALVAIITFALGIGANTAIFSFADLIIRRPISLPGLDRLVSIEEQTPTSDDKGISPANYLDLEEANHAFEHLAAYEYWSAGVGDQDQPYEAAGVRGSAISSQQSGSNRSSAAISFLAKMLREEVVSSFSATRFGDSALRPTLLL